MVEDAPAPTWETPGYAPPGYGMPPAGDGYPGYGYGYGGYPVPAPTDTLAVVGLVVAILGLAANVVIPGLPLLLSPVGAVLGHLAMRRIDRDKRTSGRGLGLAAAIIGWIGTALLVVAVAGVVWFFWALANDGH